MCGYGPVYPRDVREVYFGDTGCRVIYTSTRVTVKERDSMTPTVFEILMVITLGSLAGAIMGLGIGWAAKKQKNPWSSMTRGDKITNITLVIVFAILCIAVLAYYSFSSPTVS